MNEALKHLDAAGVGNVLFAGWYLNRLQSTQRYMPLSAQLEATTVIKPCSMATLVLLLML